MLLQGLQERVAQDPLFGPAAFRWPLKAHHEEPQVPRQAGASSERDLRYFLA
jgi:hypothetical protein